MSRRSQRILYVIALLLSAVAGYEVDHLLHQSSAAATSQPVDEATVPVPVQTVPIRQGDIDQTVEAYGIVQSQPGRSIVISAPFEATVKSIAVASGQSVDGQTPLLQIVASPDSLLQLRQANDSVDGAQRNLDQVQKRLANQLATNSDLALAQQALQTAQTQLASLKKRGIGTDRTINAEAAGVVTLISVQPGQLAAAGAPLMTITPAAAREVKLGVDPSNIVAVREGLTVELRALDAAADRASSAGRIHFIAAQINPTSRLRDVFVSIATDSPLPEGSFVVGQIVTDKAAGLIVPRAAAHFDDGAWIVFTVNDGKAVRHAVKLGAANAVENLIIADDLHEGDAVISQANADLDDGTAIAAQAAEATSTPATSEPAATEPAAMGPAAAKPTSAEPASTSTRSAEHV